LWHQQDRPLPSKSAGRAGNSLHLEAARIAWRYSPPCSPPYPPWFIGLGFTSLWSGALAARHDLRCVVPSKPDL